MQTGRLICVFIVLFSAHLECDGDVVVFSETWETTPATSSELPGDWTRRGQNATSGHRVIRPTGDQQFNQAEPLAGPAGGNQALRLAGVNRGVFVLPAITIEANREYTLSAAVGQSLDNAEANQFWSLQLWADTNTNGVINTAPTDTFLGQTFGTLAGAQNPTAGEWALNSISFDSDDFPDVVGEDLIIYLNNFNTGVSYYDNVTLTVSGVPEPSSVGALMLLAVFALRHRRRQLTT